MLQRSDFADDLRRFIEHQPIRSTPPTVRDKVVKWSRRHPAGIRATIIAFVTTVLAIGATLEWVIRDHAVRQAALSVQVNQSLVEAKTQYEADQLREALAAVNRAKGMLANGEATEGLEQSVRTWLSDLEAANRLELIRTNATAQ